MPVKGLQLLPFVVAVLLTGPAVAQETPHRMIGGNVDLRSAVLSPKPFGPPSQFEPPTSAARADAPRPDVATSEPAKAEPVKSETAQSEGAKSQPAKSEAKSESSKSEMAKSGSDPKEARSKASTPRKTVDRKPRQKPAVARRKSKANPLDSYARDDRRQVWPCTGGGGICNWMQSR